MLILIFKVDFTYNFPLWFYTTFSRGKIMLLHILHVLNL